MREEAFTWLGSLCFSERLLGKKRICWRNENIRPWINVGREDTFIERNTLFLPTGLIVQIRLTIFLLIYWGLLVNLGPSLHTHSFFGLHDSCCAPAASVQDNQCCSGCCSTPTQSTPVTSEISSTHDCSLCDFFDYLNISTAEYFQPASEQSLEPVFASRDCLLSEAQISNRARGPPATC